MIVLYIVLKKDLEQKRKITKIGEERNSKEKEEL